jgi:hypothetical protein
MRPANDNETSSRLPSAAWLAALAVSAAFLIYGTFVVLNLTGLR